MGELEGESRCRSCESSNLSKSAGSHPCAGGRTGHKNGADGGEDHAE